MLKTIFRLRGPRRAAMILAALVGVAGFGHGPQALAAPAPKAAPVTVTLVTPAGLKQAIAASKGHVVLVNFWATWCAPCVAELPALAKLRQANARKGLKVLLVSADDPTQGIAPIKKTLTQKNQPASFLIQGDMLSFFNKFDPAEKGAIGLPRSYVYNRQGKLVKTLPQDHTLAEYQKILAPYL